MEQLRALVLHMEDNPEIARGVPVFGATKLSVEENWIKLCKNLNALGPPNRSIGEWKKSWADLKSRTKKKIADNHKSQIQTGGGLYRYSCLTELETIIDRTLSISSAAAPSGPVFGAEIQSIDECFLKLVESPARSSKTIAVVTPNRKENTNEKDLPSIKKNQPSTITTKRKQGYLSDSDSELPVYHSAKKKKIVDEQLSLIRRQLRVAERSAATATDQANSFKRMADAAEMQAESAKRTADASEMQAEAAKRTADAAEATAATLKELVKITESIENILQNVLN